MYETEIHEALDRKDYDALWRLMARRTSWMQNTLIPVEEVSRLQVETQNIAGRIQDAMADLQGRMLALSEQHHAASAYEVWREPR